MTATQAPTPGPLSASDVKLLVKLLDTLKPFAEVAEKLKHCHVVEICEPTPDNPSRNIIPMPREWFERAGDDLECIAIQLHASGVLSEGQTSNITGLDRVSVRREVDRLAPTAPVEASGSEREHGPKCWGKTSISDEMMYCYCGSTDLRPQPSGETRPTDEEIRSAIKATEYKYFGDYEFTEDQHAAVDVLVRAAQVLLSARPLALGGQQGEIEEALSCLADYDHTGRLEQAVRAALSTNPARAEAQDEGAAGEPVASGCGYSGYEFGGGYPDSTCIDGYLWDLDSCDEPGGGLTHGGDIPCPQCNAETQDAHPSPTPAADADRVRKAAIVAKNMADNASFNLNQAGLTQETATCDRAFLDIYHTLDAALKSEGK